MNGGGKDRWKSDLANLSQDTSLARQRPPFSDGENADLTEGHPALFAGGYPVSRQLAGELPPFGSRLCSR
jgi:hypothetical protein